MLKQIGKHNMHFKQLLFLCVLCLSLFSCKSNQQNEVNMEKTMQSILGDPNYVGMSFGGYRANTREVQPSVEELKEDLKILNAIGVKVIRTYNVHLPHAENTLKAIRILKNENPEFEMYVMLGAWIDCKNAWTDFNPIHNEESERNAVEINKAVELSNEYSDIVKAISVGNEAMVKWATAYYVEPHIILKWVNHLQELKTNNELNPSVWITSSDNFASWGGGDTSYHVEALNQLIHAVDFISVHTYPMHDTHYNPIFWGLKESEKEWTKQEKIDVVMKRAVAYTKSQYEAVKKYVENQGVTKPIHIGETGWASVSNQFYGEFGSRACDEYKAGKYYELIREWTKEEHLTCFYFEAFDEPWKDPINLNGSENFFGLFTVEGNAKYALWNLADENKFEGLERGGSPIVKTYNGDIDSLLNDVFVPPIKDKLSTNYKAQ